jgi:alkylation response protein AidB-like acyl-CoA dehydrogenase
MDFVFTDEQRMIAETAQAFFTENATSERTRAAMAADGIDHALWQAFCQELGLSGIGIPEAAGGAGLGLVELAIIAEWLPALLSGETIAAHVASDDLVAEGDRLTGTSAFVAHGAAAQLLLVSGAGGSWLVRADAPGVTVTAQTTMDQTRPYARVTLAGAEGEPLADPQAGGKAATEAGMVVLAAEGLGLAQAALDRTVAYARDRVQFGRAIGSFQAYKHRLADMMVEIEQARSAVYWAACAVEEGSDEAALALHAAKCFCADTAFRCAGDMIQLHGGIGFTWEHDAHLFFKRARALQTLMGKNDWHREQIAAMVLGETA